jgi:SAM-dependent methyltransferase
LVSTYPLPDPAALDAHYSTKFRDGNYRLLQAYTEQYRRVYDGFAQILARKLKARGQSLRGQTILDIGCFTGEFLELLRQRGADVYGLELQSEAVSIAGGKLPGRIFKADVFSDNFPQIPCDIVTLMGVIEHVTDPVKLLRRSSSLLKEDGILMLQTPDSTSLLAGIMGKFWPPYEPVEHIHLFGRKSLERILLELGYGNIEFRPHWKKLPISYVYSMLRNFGPELYRLVGPFYRFLPRFVTGRSFPFYIGEMIVIAQRGH